MKHFLKIFFALLFFPVYGFAEKIIFEATADRTQLGVGEEVVITFISNTEMTSFQMPSFDGFRISSGPYSSQSVNIVNGKVSVQTSLAYSLTPIHDGTLKIGKATITVKGKTYYTKPIQINVSVSLTGSISKTSKNQIISTGKNKDVFIATSVNRDTVYEGEPILITHKVYSVYEIINYEDLFYPSYDGFWTKIMSESRGQNDPEEMGGKEYYTYVLREVIACPQKTGIIPIKAMNGKILVTEGSTPRDIYGNLINNEKEYKLKGNDAQIFVIPLTQKNKPSDFKKNVGTFSIECSADKNELKQNEALTLSVIVSGNGNFDLMEAPEIKVPDGMDVFPAKTKDEYDLTPEGVMGNKTFDYVIIPRKEGSFFLQPGVFSFFDLKKHDYVTLSFPNIKVKVNKSDGSDSGDFFYSENVNDSIWKHPGIYFVIVIPSFAILIFLYVKKKKAAEIPHQQIPVAKEKATVKKEFILPPLIIQDEFLAEAGDHLHKGHTNKFYDVLHKGLYSYLSLKLNITKAEITKEKIRQSLLAKQFSISETEKLIELLSECEMAKYAHAPASDSAKKMLAEAKKLVHDIEKLPE